MFHPVVTWEVTGEAEPYDRCDASGASPTLGYAGGGCSEAEGAFGITPLRLWPPGLWKLPGLAPMGWESGTWISLSL